MHKNPGLDSHSLDAQLAVFTDQLLSEAAWQGERWILSEDQELRVLQETVILLQRVVSVAQPDEAMKQRIHNNLIAQWNTPGVQARVGAWDRIRTWLMPPRPVWQSAGSMQRTYALRLAWAAFVLLSLVLLVSPVVGDALTAVASGPGEWRPIIIIACVLVVIVLAWLLRRR